MCVLVLKTESWLRCFGSGFWPTERLIMKTKDRLESVGCADDPRQVSPQPRAKAAGPRARMASTRPIPAWPSGCVSGGVGLAAAFRYHSLRPEHKRHMRSRSGPGVACGKNTLRKNDDASRRVTRQRPDADALKRGAMKEPPNSRQVCHFRHQDLTRCWRGATDMATLMALA